MKRAGLIIQEEHREAWESLPDEECGKLLKVLIAYQFDGTISHELSPALRMAFTLLRPIIDKQRIEYESICKKRKEAAAARWDRVQMNASAYNSMQTNASARNRIEGNRIEENIILPPISYEICPPTLQGGDAPQLERVDNDKSKHTAKEQRPRFVRPSVEDVSEYIAEKGYTVDAGNFIDYYEANGWKVGRNLMKDWRAAVRTWQQREQADNRTRRTTGKPQQSNGVTLGYDERIEADGRRTYGTGKATIPPDAPPRPSERYAWDTATGKWILL